MDSSICNLDDWLDEDLLDELNVGLSMDKGVAIAGFFGWPCFS
jgi:hypothetical protein